MGSLTNISCNITLNDVNACFKSKMDPSDVTRPILGVISALSFVCNGILCAVMLKTRSMLSKSYNVLIFVLAVTDCLTGIFLFISPTYVLGSETVPLPTGIAGELFCRIIDRGYFVWVFAKFSVTMITLMAIERWFAVARPNSYKSIFKRRKVVFYAMSLLIFSAVTNLNLLFDIKLETRKSPPACVFYSSFTTKEADQIFTIMYCTLTVFVPLFVTTATYVHLRFAIRGQGAMENFRTQQLEVKLVRMSAIVALCIVICFLPNQISYILTKFDVYKYNSPQSLVTVLLAMTNSCINPWVYFCTNKSYRKEFIHFFCPRKRNEVGLFRMTFQSSSEGTRLKI